MTQLQESWYQNLIEDCRAILIQRTLRARLELIYCYGEIGERIVTDANYKKFAHGNQEFLEDIFEAIELKKRLGYKAIELYEFVKREYEKKSLPLGAIFEDMFESIIDVFEEGNNISFKKILIKYLPIDKAHVSLATGENEWYTPPSYIEAIHRTMGDIDVDPASTEVANSIVKAKNFYTKEDDALNKPWEGNVFLNPPYEQPQIDQFCNAFVEKFNSGEIKQGCVLVNNATETNWFQELAKECVAICFPKGRIKFLDKEMKPGAPLQGQAILYFGDKAKEFKQEFSEFGIIK